MRRGIEAAREELLAGIRDQFEDLLGLQQVERREAQARRVLEDGQRATGALWMAMHELQGAESEGRRRLHGVSLQVFFLILQNVELHFFLERRIL